MARRRKIKLLPIEKIMIKLCVLLLVLMPASNIFGKAMISKSNIEVERLRRQVSIRVRKNQSLVMKVNELRSFDNIQAVASKQGLAYNGANVRVIDID